MIVTWQYKMLQVVIFLIIRRSIVLMHVREDNKIVIYPSIERTRMTNILTFDFRLDRTRKKKDTVESLSRLSLLPSALNFLPNFLSCWMRNSYSVLVTCNRLWQV